MDFHTSTHNPRCPNSDTCLLPADLSRAASRGQLSPDDYDIVTAIATIALTDTEARNANHAITLFADE
jgi:hypothetical protein